MTTRRTMQVLAAAMLVATVAVAGADEAGLSTAGTMRDALGTLAGKDVEVVLSNGKSYRGKVGSVGNETVLVTQIAGKEFYDVLIELDEVAAVEVRVRGN
ncbi:MAG: hypothetical protein ABIR79_12260 [Candidatus Binatia bacterium]